MICLKVKSLDIIGCHIHTSRDHGLNPGAVDERSLDGLSPDVWPVDTMLQGVIVHCRHVIDVGHSEGDNVVVVRVVDVHSSDLVLASVEQKLTRLCARGEVDKNPSEERQSCGVAHSRHTGGLVVAAWMVASVHYSCHGH